MEKNYSPKDEQTLLEVYNPESDQGERDKQVNILADQLGRKPRSIIAKLSRMGIYKAKERTTKTGEPVEHKKDIVLSIAEAVGVGLTSLTSLTKATKSDLKVLAKALNESLES